MPDLSTPMEEVTDLLLDVVGMMEDRNWHHAKLDDIRNMFYQWAVSMTHWGHTVVELQVPNVDHLPFEEPA